MQHNSHMVPRGQPSHVVHSVSGQNPGSRIQVRDMEIFGNAALDLLRT